MAVNQAFVTLSAASTGGNTPNVINSSCRGLKVVVDITAVASGTLTVLVKGKDVLSGKYYTILSSAGLASTGTTVLTVYPGMTAVTNVTANDVIPNTFAVFYTISGGTVTGTIGGSLIS